MRIKLDENLPQSPLASSVARSTPKPLRSETRQSSVRSVMFIAAWSSNAAKLRRSGMQIYGQECRIDSQICPS
jgi:hypothetical protein